MATGQESIPKLLREQICSAKGERQLMSLFSMDAPQNLPPEAMDCAGQLPLVTLSAWVELAKPLAVKLAEQVQDKFEYLIWRSLRAPPIKDLLRELILFLSHQQVNLPETVDSLISRLMEYRSSRCLLVLDNGESILRSGEQAERYCSGYEGYGQLLRRVGDERHQSCLVLTSREKPIGLTAKEGKPVRSLQLSGLPGRSTGNTQS